MSSIALRLVCAAVCATSSQMGAAGAQQFYSIGEPTDEEQLFVEFINRARAQPQQEAQRLKNATDPDALVAYDYFDVDLNLMVSQFSNIAAAPPLSISPKLTASARSHSQDMLAHQLDAHAGSNGSTYDQRIRTQGFTFSTVGENVYAHARSVVHGHIAFEVDWGPGTSGMQKPPGHRNNDHYAGFREIGVGLVSGTNGTVGPLLITQDFGTQQSSSPFITGVVYYDLNGNGFYDVGEGLGGVTVQVTGASFAAVTSNSGGYSVPVPGNGTYAVTFSANNLNDQQFSASVSALNNVKRDYTPVYKPPVITGTSAPVLNQDTTYQFSAVGGAASYQVKRSSYTAFKAVEGAENGLTNVITNTTRKDSSRDDYVIDSEVKFAGAYSFHLAHPNAEQESLQLKPVLHPSATSALKFRSRLGWATSTQIARAQVSADGGATWQTLWSQAGTGDRGETSFNARSVSLATFADQEIQIRFVYDISDSYFPQTSAGVGFYIDDIEVTNAEQATGTVTTNVPSGTSFVFRPSVTGKFGLQVRAKAANRFFPWGPVKIVNATTAPPVTFTRGSYSGLIQSDPPSNEGAGFLTISVNTNGTFTASIRFGGKAYAATGRFDRDGNASVKTAGKSPLTLTLHNDPTGSTDQITGAISPTTNTALIGNIVANCAVFHPKSNPVENALVGKYTVLFPPPADATLPQGSGYGTVSVSSDGSIRCAGVLGDGTRFTQSAPLSKTFTWPFFVALYASQGSLLGELAFEDASDSDIAGTLAWFKPQRPKDAFYPSGFSTTTSFIGSFYVPLAPVLSFPDNGAGKVTFSSGGLNPTPAPKFVTLNTNNKLTIATAEKLKMTIAPRSGLFSGTFVDGAGKSRAFQGAVFQKGNFGKGQFKGTTQTGSIDFTKAP